MDGRAVKDIEFEIIIFDAYVQTNLPLGSGDLDANYFQHISHPEIFCVDNGTKFVSTGAVHYEPMNVHSNLSKAYTVDAIPDDAVISVQNNPTNEARTINLLAA